MAKFKVGDVIRVQYANTSARQYINVITSIDNIGYHGKCINLKYDSGFSQSTRAVDNAYEVTKLASSVEEAQQLYPELFI